MFNLAAGGNSRLRSRLPYWDAPYYSGMDLVFDAQKGGFRNDPAIGLDLSTLVSDVHSSAILAPNAAGVYSSIAANLLTRTDLGIQTVPTRTNLVTNVDFSTAGWSLSNGATATFNDNVAPDGSMTASTLTDPLTTGDTFVGRVFAIANDNAIYAVSCFFKKTTGTPTSYPALFAAYTGGTTVTGYVVLNTTTGTFNASGATNIIVEDRGAYWRVSFALTNNTSGNTQANVRIYPAWNSTGAGTGRDATATGSVVAAWYQFELGAFASAPILTTGSASTVNGNRQFISGLGSQLANGVAGFVQFNAKQMGTANGERTLSFNDGTIANQVIIRPNASQVSLIVLSGGVTQFSAVDNFVLSLDTNYTIAFSAAAGFGRMQIVGRAVQSGTGGVWPVLNMLGIAGHGYANNLNSYQQTRKLALDFLSPSDDPATVFNRVYNQAVLAAAA